MAWVIRGDNRREVGTSQGQILLSVINGLSRLSLCPPFSGITVPVKHSVMGTRLDGVRGAMKSACPDERLTGSPSTLAACSHLEKHSLLFFTTPGNVTSLPSCPGKGHGWSWPSSDWIRLASGVEKPKFTMLRNYHNTRLAIACGTSTICKSKLKVAPPNSVSATP